MRAALDKHSDGNRGRLHTAAAARLGGDDLGAGLRPLIQHSGERLVEARASKSSGEELGSMWRLLAKMVVTKRKAGNNNLAEL